MNQLNKSNNILDSAFKKAAQEVPVTFENSMWESLNDSLDQAMPASPSNTSWLQNINLNGILLTTIAVVSVTAALVLLNSPSEKVPVQEIIPAVVIPKDSINSTIEVDTSSVNSPKEKSASKIKMTVIPKSTDTLVIPIDSTKVDSVKTDSLDDFIFW